MTDYSEQGAVPIEDAVVEDPPTVDEVLEEQRRRERERDAQRDRGTATDDSPMP
jgi:hypothetical protein